MKKFLLVLTFLPSVFCGQVSPNASVTIDTSAPVCNVGDCVSLNANYTNSNETDSYTVSSIPYSSFAYSGGTLLPSTDSTGLQNDDFWFLTIALPFEFSFYNNCYNQLLIGVNGVITFDTTNHQADGYCDWAYSQTIPNANFPIKNAIYGVYQDIHFANRPVTSNINHYISGTAPNRVFVINYFEIPTFPGQSTNLQTSQIVLHETINVIDVNIKRRDPNLAWNSGNGVVGIQNQAGTSAYFPLGRNTGNWSATNESWRFTPNGVLTSQFTWKRNGIAIGNQNPITVCYNQPNDVYQASVSYNGCTTTIAESSVTLDLIPQPAFGTPINIIDCPNLPDVTFNTVDLTINNQIILNGINNPDYFEISYFTSLLDAELGSNQIMFPQNYIPFPNPQTIYARIDNMENGCFKVDTFTVTSNYVSMPTGNSNQNFTQGQTLQNLVINGTNVQWYANQLIGTTLPLTTPLVDGTTYHATQTINGCESPERLPVTAHLTLANDTFLFQNLKIQPNPVTDIFIVSNQNNLDLVEVYNTIGQTIISKKVNDNQVKVDLSNYNSGVYFVKVYSENQNRTIKIIKN